MLPETASWYLLLPILLPLLGALALWLLPGLQNPARRRRVVILLMSMTLLSLAPVLLSGEMEIVLFRFSARVPVLLRTDLTGKCFALLVAFVWFLAGIYSLEYMEHENDLCRFYAFYLATLGVLMGLCFAGSIITYYMFYELMTLLTVPLVMHTMEKEAVSAGIKYLIYSVLGASLVLLGVFLLSPYLPTFSFLPGGALDLEASSATDGRLLAAAMLMILGFGTKAGMFPLHGWLPTAHPVAPAPASAVLSGIITKAGVLGIFRTVYQLIGSEQLRGTWVQTAFMSLTLFTVFMGSLLAYREDLFKKRLAFSSVSQVSYVLFGLSTLHPLGLTGALLHVCAHSLIKDTLFMSAGAVIHRTGKTRVSEMEGIGKQMPWVMGCFTMVSIGLIGIPPCLGFVSKWYLAQGALAMTGVPSFFSWLAPAVLLISALLTAGYLMTISIRGFFPGRGEEGAPQAWENREPSWRMLLPMLLLTVLSVGLGLVPGGLTAVFTSIVSSVL